MRLKFGNGGWGRGHEMKVGRWAGVGQGSLLDSMAPVLSSSTHNPLPATPRLPSPTPLHPHLPTTSALRAGSVRKASGSLRRGPRASRTQTSQKAWERRARAWVRARAGQMGGTFRGSFISSWNLARLLPTLGPSPHSSHGPRLTSPGYPASLDPWKQV